MYVKLHKAMVLYCSLDSKVAVQVNYSKNPLLTRSDQGGHIFVRLFLSCTFC